MLQLIFELLNFIEQLLILFFDASAERDLALYADSFMATTIIYNGIAAYHFLDGSSEKPRKDYRVMDIWHLSFSLMQSIEQIF